MRGIWVPLSGAIAQQRNIETIANNVANANTPGFKKNTAVFKEYLTILQKGNANIDIPTKEFKPADFYRTQGAQHGYVETDGIYTLFEQGQLTPTNNPLDWALVGKGFFEILTPNGIRFTRKGTLTLSNNGELVTDQGYRLLSDISKEATEEEKADIKSRIIKLGSGKIFIDQNGTIYLNDKKMKKVSLVEFRDPHTLRKEGNSLFINIDENNAIRENIKSTVRQGFVEESNVNAITEMSELIKAHRHFESIQRAMKAYDSMASKSVNEIAKFQ